MKKLKLREAEQFAKHFTVTRYEAGMCLGRIPVWFSSLPAAASWKQALPDNGMLLEFGQNLSIQQDLVYLQWNTRSCYSTMTCKTGWLKGFWTFQ